MKIDLNYLNRFSRVTIDEDFTIDETYLENTDIRKLENLHISGIVDIDYEDTININLELSGIMILPCAISLEDVKYEFNTTIEQNLGKFEEIFKKNKNSLEISDILWENIVLEIPIRVVSESAEPSNTSGDGWELISE